MRNGFQIKRIFVCALICSTLSTFAGQATKPAPANKPQPIKSFSALTKLLQATQPKYYFANATTTSTTPSGANLLAPSSTGATPGAATSTPSGTGSSNNGDVPFSTTNVQVAGVDEADIVKTDGQFIYQVSGAQVFVINAFPETGLAVTSTLSFGSDFYPMQLFLDGQNLVVIGSSFRSGPVFGDVFAFPSESVKAIVYDVTNKADVKEVREVEIDGSYVSSRRIDDNVYLIARKYPDFYLLPLAAGATPGVAPQAETRAVAKHSTKGLVPVVRDSGKKGKGRYQRMKPKNVFFFPDFIEPDYVVIAAFNAANPLIPLEVNAYLGAADTVYASAQNLYVSAALFPPLIFTSNGNAGVGTGAAPAGGATGLFIPFPPISQPVHSSIYKFALQGGNVVFTAQGDVPGTVLNQFSMDESGGNFRIATASNAYTAQASSGVYVLDASMNTIGKVEGIAPGESLFAARFINTRCYLDAFKLTDPLFVVDLSQPTAPAVLGQLNIPGFSNYLQPFDDTHLLGFGKNTVNGFYQGMQVVLFDVGDVNNPVVNSSLTLGDRGTDSEVLYDPKALLFDATNNLLVFPIQVAQIANKTANSPPESYGDTVFNGAYAFSITLDQGFVLKGAITHVSPGEDVNSYNRNIHRSLFIGNDLFTLSDSRVKANDLGTIAEKAVLDLPVPPAPAPLNAGGVAGPPVLPATATGQ